jgi:hypothetical protein
MIIMSPLDAAAAAFGYVQHGPKNFTQCSHVTNEENICFGKTEPIQEDSSATAVLFQKFVTLLGSVIHKFGIGETFVQPIADIRATTRIISEMLTSLIASSSKLPVPDIVEDISLDSSIYTLSEHQTPVGTPPQSCGGLALLSSELLLEDDSNERLNYSISQLDVLRMSRAASRRLRVDSIDELPTTIYHEEQNELICSSHEECEEELQGDVHVPVVTGIKDTVFQHTLQQGDCPEFSWLMVPEDPLQDDLTRISKQNDQLGVVPESISICSSHHSEKKDHDAFDHCVICQEPFQEGENLRVLPCEHLFHCGCIDKQGENSEEDAGCPMCKKDLQEPQGESYHSDGSVPSWSFKRLGSLLASMSK